MKLILLFNQATYNRCTTDLMVIWVSDGDKGKFCG